jgi:hypothetical protein
VNNFFEDIIDHDWSDGKRVTFFQEYDLKDDNYIQLLDADSADANTMVKLHDLNFDVSTRHYKFGGAEKIGIEWTFWK